MKALLALAILATTSCLTTSTKTTLPDGTVIEQTVKGTDSASIGAVASGASALAPYVIHHDK